MGIGWWGTAINLGINHLHTDENAVSDRQSSTAAVSGVQNKQQGSQDGALRHAELDVLLG